MHKDRCPLCGLYRDCLCSDISPLQTTTQVIIIIHRSELRQPSNTARLAHLLLSNSRFCIHGKKDGPTKIKLDPERRYYTLYPRPQSLILDEKIVNCDSRPITLLIPDGSWRQTKRMVKRVPALMQSPTVILPPGPPTQYDLRRQMHKGCLSTLEAIARALGVLEGSEVQNFLENHHQKMVEREMVLRGLRPSWETKNED